MQSSAGLRSAFARDLPSAPDFLTSDMSVADVMCSQLFSSFFKKFVEDVKPDADSKCLELFLESNLRCKEFVLQPTELFDDLIIGETHKVLYNVFHHEGLPAFGRSDLDRLLLPGPGASVAARGDSFYTKLFDSPLSYTDDRLLSFYRQAIRLDPSWAPAEQRRSSNYGERRVEGNRLSFVPKTSDISRAICTEPSVNMLWQKAIGERLEILLRKHFSIDLSKQPDLNKALARQGSIDQSYGTIDLKSASDSIALPLLDRLLPEYVMYWLRLSRSSTVTLPSGDVVELYMVSSMGNGFTFPLQTILFASILKACYSLSGIKFLRNRGQPLNYGVFGDDIIVDQRVYYLMCRALRLFGFIVNSEKSFNVGHFRESCGGDYWKGTDVRGLYIRSLASDADVYSSLNRLVRWCAKSGYLLPTTFRWLLEQVKFLPVPLHANDDEGVKVPLRLAQHLPRNKNGSVKYRRLVPKPLQLRVPSDEQVVTYYPFSGKAFRYNRDGLVVALLGGFLQNGRISLRTPKGKRVRYQVVKAVTPHWEWQSDADLRSRVDDWKIVYELLATFG